MRWIIRTGVFSLIVAAFGSMILQDLQYSWRHRRTHDLIGAISKGRQVGTALLNFESDYGKYPDSSTALVVKARTGSTWTLGDGTSNELFEQLLVSGIGKSEEIFFFQTPWSRKPDNLFSTESQALEKGECVFAYIAGLVSTDAPNTPICVAPLQPGKLIFETEIFGGKAFMVRLDNSVITLPIDKSGHAILNGMDLFDPRQPFWHGKAPNVKWPK